MTIINNTSNCNNTTQINNNTINISIRPFGKENLDYITPTYILRLLEKCRCEFPGEEEKQKFVGQMYKAIHANPEHPENHNMIIPSLKGSIAKVHTEEGEQYVHRKAAENKVLGTIADVSYKNVAEVHEDSDEEESRKKCKNNYGSFVSKYIEGDDAYDDDSHKRKNTRNRHTVAQMSYNCKTIVKETQQKSNGLIE